MAWDVDVGFGVGKVGPHEIWAKVFHSMTDSQVLEQLFVLHFFLCVHIAIVAG